MKILYLLIAALKFLGIAFLLLLLLVLLIVIIILTVPIRYSVYLNKSEDMYVYTKIKWLYSIIGMDIIYNSGSKTTKTLKLFGRPFVPQKFKRLKRKIVKKAVHTIDMDNIHNQQENANTSKKSQDNQEDSPKKKKKSNNKKSGIKELIGQIQLFRHKKELFADTISWIGNLLKNLVPSTLYMEIEIGREDPADTGQLIATVSALYPLYYSFANIVGNYEKECFYAKIELNGDITLGRCIYDLIKYIRTSSVKALIKFTRENRKGKKDGRKVTK